MERCHFWLGCFNDQAEVQEYFEEIVPYPEDGPISLFAVDQQKRFYDHDWVFAEFREDSDLYAILATIRAPLQTRDAILAIAAKTTVEWNTIVGADEGEFANPVSVPGLPRLEYVGCHPLWRRTADAEHDATPKSTE